LCNFVKKKVAEIKVDQIIISNFLFHNSFKGHLIQSHFTQDHHVHPPFMGTYMLKDVGSSFLKLLDFLKVILIGAERKTMLKNAIKIIGPCALFLPGSLKDMKFDEI